MSLDPIRLRACATALKLEAAELEAFAAELERAAVFPAPAAPVPAAPLVAPPPAWTPRASAGLQALDPVWAALTASPAVFGGRLTDSQKAGVLRLCVAGAGVLPTGWMAYVLATAYHESGHGMVPIHELGSDAYLSKYDTGALAAALGNTPEADGDGIKWAGRGDVQLTGFGNYKRADIKLAALGLIKPGELLANPDLALRPDCSAAVAVWGMREGWFTGKRLNDFIASRGTLDQFIHARAIINGQDKAALIAGYAVAFQAAITLGGWL